MLGAWLGIGGLTLIAITVLVWSWRNAQRQLGEEREIARSNAEALKRSKVQHDISALPIGVSDALDRLRERAKKRG